MFIFRVARKLRINPATAYYWLQGKSYPSAKNLKKLYEFTGVPPQAWLNPEKYFNPYCPYRYKGFYPPYLAHLSGEALEYAKQIIFSFRDRPPTKEEFTEFKKLALQIEKMKKKLSKQKEGGRENG